MARKIPTTIITGFLGAGKTTLLKHLLEQAQDRRIAVIVNEFGDMGIDGAILDDCAGCARDDIVELANGCICCTVADEFVPTMTRLLARDKPPDHIIIETSGLALPQPLVRAFNWPEIRNRVTVDGVITVVDSPAVIAGNFASDPQALQAQRLADEKIDHETPVGELFADQLSCADLVLLNKTDQLTAEQATELRKMLKTRSRPGVQVVSCRHGRIDLLATLGLSAAAETDIAQRRSHHEMRGEDDHDHDDFESFVVTLDQPCKRRAILARIAEVIEDHDIMRIKGFVSVEDAPARLQVQAVGPRLESYFDRNWADDEPRLSTLVIIGLAGLKRQEITATLRDSGR